MKMNKMIYKSIKKVYNCNNNNNKEYFYEKINYYINNGNWIKFD